MSALDSVIPDTANIEELTPDRTLDNRGGDCASGFVKLLDVMATIEPGGLLAVRSSDPASRRELREWAARAGHSLLDARTTGPFWRREYRYLIRKGNDHG